MKAMVLRRQAPIPERPLAPAELPDPEPGPGEVRVRVAACAVCRTDLHVIEGDLPARRLPLVPGHQAVGRIDRLGPGSNRFRAGERIGIAWLRFTCGTCDRCGDGRENLCERSRYTGYHADGGYAELALVPEAFAYRIPDAFSDVQAAPLLCAGIVGYRALARSNVRDGGKLGLYGFGSSARVVMQLALARGCEIYVATRGPSRQAAAREMGAVWAAGTDDAPPQPLDAAIVFAPAGEVVPAALRAVDKGGTVALAGVHMTPTPPLDYESCLFHEKNLTSVEANTREDGEALLAEAAKVPLRTHVTHFPLERANDALLGLARGTLEGTAVLTIGSDAER